MMKKKASWKSSVLMAEKASTNIRLEMITAVAMKSFVCNLDTEIFLKMKYYDASTLGVKKLTK